MCCPSSLTSPTAAIASFVGMQVKICFFLFFSFRSFSDQCYSASLSHIPGPQTPASPPHNPYPHALPSSLTNPATAIACICGHTSKDKFFSSFFCFFSDQCYRDPLYPSCQVLKPPPLHPIIPTPHLAPYAPQVPAPASAATATPSLCTRSAHDADPPRASPAVAPPQHGTQDCRTPPRRHPQHGTQDRDCDKQPQQWRRRWSSSGDGDSGGQWDGGGSDGSDGKALLLP